MTTTKKPKRAKYIFEIKRSLKNKEYFWRATHRNGKIVAGGEETYQRKGACRRSLVNILTAIANGDFEVKE